MRAAGTELGLDVEVRQTDAEAEMIGWLHEAADGGAAVVLNPGAFRTTRTRCATPARMLRAAGRGAHHQPAAREEFRHTRVVSAVATGVIAGFGVESTGSRCAP